MSRPADWSPLDMGSDPTPGDAATVLAAGKHYTEVADAIELASRRLKELAENPDMKSEAVEKFRGKATTVSTNVSKAETRYRETGEALTTYATELQAAQEDADAALKSAVCARDDHEAANTQLSSARDDLRHGESENACRPADQAPRDLSHLIQRVSCLNDQCSAAASDLTDAKEKAETAKQDAKDAADKARRAIEDVVEDSELNDSTWDKVANVLSKIADIAGAIAAIAGILALVVGWIPIIGQALAAVLGAIALIAGIISLLCNVALLVGGKGSWADVIMDAVGVLSFGIGRVALKGGQAAFKAVSAVSRLKAGKLAALPAAMRAQRGLPSMGSARSVMKALTGKGDDFVNMSRGRALNMLDDARDMSKMRSLLSGTFDDFTDFGRNLRTAFDPANLRAALRDSPDALRSLGGSLRNGHFNDAFAKLVQDGDMLAHLQSVRGMDDAVKSMSAIRQATVSITTQELLTLGGAGIDGFQYVHDALSGDPAVVDLGDVGAGDFDFDSLSQFDTEKAAG
ncbi:hypothetical protein [Nocardioides acrostichi]|uniref:Uncharacterized protein n=1 Tax=Nocardioides acrostichi TaxID=2784339 RepID=A0A930UXF8_9ACTN|nr:hypothetical protein [Nocardioides acrostichi]MBF4161472.1 hypothetical protein [Nocardioides acrostichi]